MYATNVFPSLIESFVFFFLCRSQLKSHQFQVCYQQWCWHCLFSIALVSLFLLCVAFSCIEVYLTDESDWLYVRYSTDNGPCAKKKSMQNWSQPTNDSQIIEIFSTVHGIKRTHHDCIWFACKYILFCAVEGIPFKHGEIKTSKKGKSVMENVELI